MTIYAVTDNSTSEVVYRYEAEAPVEWVGMEFATHTHTAEPAPPAPPASPPVYGGRRRLSKQEFYDLLGDQGQTALLTLAKSNVEIERWIKRFDILSSDSDGLSVELDDPRTVAGVNALEPVLVALGYVSAGWAAGVLNG